MHYVYASPPPPPPRNQDEQAAASFLLSLKKGDSRSASPNSTEAGHERYDANAHEQQQQHPPASAKDEPMDVPSLVAHADLVSLDDRDLVPDALFVCMAQMHKTALSAADRVGCYKSRPLGFPGMSCKHCQGQPGFGRYYPNSVRSLAQTTTSQTILKHVASKCRYMPSDIRQAVLQLQSSSSTQGMSKFTAEGRPRYGSRKVFFQRIWSRLHGTKLMEDVATPGRPAHSLLAQVLQEKRERLEAAGSDDVDEEEEEDADNGDQDSEQENHEIPIVKQHPNDEQQEQPPMRKKQKVEVIERVEAVWKGEAYVG